MARRKRRNKSKSFEIEFDDGCGGTCSFNPDEVWQAVLSEDLYESLKLQMPEEPEEPVDIGDVPDDTDAEPEDDNNDDGEKMDLFEVNPETKKIEQVTE